MNNSFFSFVISTIFIFLSIGINAQQSESHGVNVERPNILWLTFEDTSAYELSVYGNKSAEQPIIEKLAEDSLVFRQATSNAPYCSPARSTLISGNYATTYGADHHRATVAPSSNRLYFPKLLKEAGYFTTNNSKRDYNVKLSKLALSGIWNEFDKKASYNSDARQPEQPFFSVFNGHMTHMSRLTSYSTKQRRDFEKSAGVSKNATPEYLPALPEVASDYQFHLEGVVDVDTWIGFFIEDLKQKGLYENTIIFVYSDHGGSSPLGKGYLSYHRSLQIPLIVHIPEKYKHLVPESSTDVINKNVSFVDFAPTVLSLAGIKAPKEMAGEAFLGRHFNHTRPYNYSFRTNQEKHFDPWRGLSDGNYHYVKTYLKRKPIMLRNDFQWGMPSNIALDDFAKTKNGKIFRDVNYSIKKGEYFYNLHRDKFDENPLTDLTAFQNKKRQFMSMEISHIIRETKDLGFIPVDFKKFKPFDEWLENDFEYDQFYDLVELVADITPADVPKLLTALKSKNEVTRFWAVQGFAELAATNKLKSAPEHLVYVANNDHLIIKTVALEALAYLNDINAIKQLITIEKNDHKRSALETIAYIRPKLLMPFLKLLKKNEQKLVFKIIQSALGLLDSNNIAGKKKRQQGVAVNQTRRELKPRP